MTESTGPTGFERSDAAPWLIGALAAGVATFLIAVPFVIHAIYPDSTEVGSIGGLPQQPEPHLQLAPSSDFATFRTAEADRLSSYGWQDRSSGIVRMPIDRAMQLLVKRGLSQWPSASSTSTERRH
ncbi:MAG TPA: hypothetical protein VFP60_09765 [Pseudolabrys sp.]|nr:hypothetical protein [Pseudolabrys sp.]